MKIKSYDNPWIGNVRHILFHAVFEAVSAGENLIGDPPEHQKTGGSGGLYLLLYAIGFFGRPDPFPDERFLGKRKACPEEFFAEAAVDAGILRGDIIRDHHPHDSTSGSRISTERFMRHCL